MMKIRVLNQDTTSDDDAPVAHGEVQEGIALELYTRALRLQSDGSLEEALKILSNLLGENIPQLEQNNGGKLPSSLAMLKYSCCYNLGTICAALKDDERALDYYFDASKEDPSYVGLWYKIGKLALKLNRFHQAAYAFFKGIDCHDSHWPCLDNLISVLYAMKYHVGCCLYIQKACEMDPNYVKGLVLRNKILKENPAISDYLQKVYNLSIVNSTCVDLEDEVAIMEIEKELENRVRQAETALDVKPLKTVEFLTIRNNMTWSWFGSELIRFHKELHDNKQSHFTFIDCSKWRFETGDNAVIEDEIKSTIPNEVVVEAQEDLPVETSIPLNEGEQFEQSTLLQTDEEMMTEVEGDCSVDTSGQKKEKEKGGYRSIKRKRDLLSDLKIWGWHSKRKSFKKTKSDRDVCIEDALRRIVPEKFTRSKSNDAEKNGEETNGSVVDQQDVEMVPTLQYEEPKSEVYFGTAQEHEAISQILSNLVHCDITVLLRIFFFALSKMWHRRWPDELIPIYLQVFTLYREHYDQPMVPLDEKLSQELKDDARGTLLYCELLHQNDHKALYSRHVAFLRTVFCSTLTKEEDYVQFSCRVNWLQAHLFIREHDTEMAVRTLQLIKEFIEMEEGRSAQVYTLVLPNVKNLNEISMKIVDDLIKHLEIVESVDAVESLYNCNRYEEVATILKRTFANQMDGDHNGKLHRTAQLAMLLHSLYYTNMTECFIFAEKCLHEALPMYLKHGQEGDRWAKLLIKCLLMLHVMIKNETILIVDTLGDEEKAQLMANLESIVCYQINRECVSVMPLKTVEPWILMHYILLREEQHQLASKRVSHVKRRKGCRNAPSDNSDSGKDDLPPSVAILFSAHEFLGPKGWCLINNGELLHFILDYVLERLDSPILEGYREKISIHIEQALFCLYQHPSKKNKLSRHLADHNVDPLPLTWQSAGQLFHFYRPSVLPEFNSYKNLSITSDLEQLLQRIVALVPPEMNPQNVVASLEDYIRQRRADMPEPLWEFTPRMRSIYYLIGDFYFKQREFTRCIKYFHMDLCINQERFDSWACIGLSHVSQIENKLNHCERMRSAEDFLSVAKCARICLRKALELDPKHTVLWIEFGSFEYMVHSYCSRVVKHDADTLNMEKFEYLENQKTDYLESSCRSFLNAINLYQPDDPEADERWLQYYMLGKIAEKQQNPPREYLKQYHTAIQLLRENGAEYPEKIVYQNPQHLSVEALELHYRIYASSVKFLQLHEGKSVKADAEAVFNRYLDLTAFPKKSQTNASKASNVTEDESVSIDVRKCLEDMLNEVERISSTVGGSQQAVMEVTDTVTAVNEGGDSRQEKDGNASEDRINRKVSSEDSSSSSESDSSSSTLETESDAVSTSTTMSDVTDCVMSESSVLSLVDRCVLGLEQCIIRLGQNYKALYRLAHLYYSFDLRKDLKKSRDLLLGEYRCGTGAIVPGLFADRRPHNFFNGIWRIPSSEIDRPGSLSAHMSRCVQLLLNVLKDTNDHQMLLDVSLQFKKCPDPDKIYIRDSERLQFSKQAFTMCVQSIRGRIGGATSSQELEVLLPELLRCHQKLNKHEMGKEDAFGPMILEVYKRIYKPTDPDKLNVVELTAKLSQQTRIVEKQKRTSQPIGPVRTPGLSTPPTLPAPGQLNVRNAGVGKEPKQRRPRGRPPYSMGPHLNRGQYKSAPTAPLMDPTFAYNYYLKQYQEELMKQYNLSQLNQYSLLGLSANQMAQLLPSAKTSAAPFGAVLDNKDISIAPVTGKAAAMPFNLSTSDTSTPTALEKETMRHVMESMLPSTSGKASTSTSTASTAPPREQSANREPVKIDDEDDVIILE